MRRRTLILALAGATAGTGGLVACGTRPGSSRAGTPPPGSRGTGTPGTAASAGPAPSSSAAPILASTTASSLVPQSITAPYAPAPGTAPARAYPVGRRSYGRFNRGAGRPLPTTVWYPAAGAAPGTGPEPVDGAAAAAGRFPLVLFSHGLTAQPSDFADLLGRWAQAGFVVAGPTYPYTHYDAVGFEPDDIANQPADASSVIDQLLALDPADPVRAIIDPTRIGAAGHSGGGITTVGLFSAVRDVRLKAGVVLSGTDFRGTPFAGPAAAMLFIHGAKDATVTWRAGHTVFEAVPWSRAMLSISDGGHVIEPWFFEPTSRTSTEFLRYALYGDPAAKARVPAAASVDGVATLESQL
jgi:dienelactone hydrolase